MRHKQILSVLVTLVGFCLAVGDAQQGSSASLPVKHETTIRLNKSALAAEPRYGSDQEKLISGYAQFHKLRPLVDLNKEGTLDNGNCHDGASPVLEILWLQDATLSFQRFIDDAAQQFQSFSDFLNERYPGSSVGVAAFRDHPVPPSALENDWCLKVYSKISANVADVGARFKGIVATSGGDLAEDSINAIKTATRSDFGWSKKKTTADGRPILKYIVLVTDAIGKADGTPADHLKVLTKEKLAKVMCREDYPTISDLKSRLERRDIGLLVFADSGPMSYWQRVVAFLGGRSAVVGFSSNQNNFIKALGSVLDHVTCQSPASNDAPLPATQPPGYKKVFEGDVAVAVEGVSSTTETDASLDRRAVNEAAPDPVTPTARAPVLADTTASTPSGGRPSPSAGSDVFPSLSPDELTANAAEGTTDTGVDASEGSQSSSGTHSGETSSTTSSEEKKSAAPGSTLAAALGGTGAAAAAVGGVVKALLSPSTSPAVDGQWETAPEVSADGGDMEQYISTRDMDFQ